MPAKGIKRIIRQPRPTLVTHTGRPKKTYGMPSTHSTALTFFYTYLVPLFPAWRIPLAVAWILGLWSRHELGYHTYTQITVGALIGVVAAVGWYTVWLYNHDFIQTWWSLIINYIQL